VSWCWGDAFWVCFSDRRATGVLELQRASCLAIPVEQISGLMHSVSFENIRRSMDDSFQPVLVGKKSDALAVPVDVTMRRATLFGVPAMPILAAPLVVRRAQVEEAGALAALLGRAFEAESWDAAGTERELFCDETVRATLVVAAEGRLVATASLQVRPDVPECGWVRWVATDLDRRREGLARALVIGVLAMARQAGCREARLHTQTDRLAAILLYLQLGFEPLVRGDSEREVWERVIAAHPLAQLNGDVRQQP
jgi:mycothiol synthase